MALYWEYKDYNRINKRKKLYEICDPVERDKELVFYATFMERNHVWWRFNYILCAIGVVFSLYLLKYKYHNLNVDVSDVIIVFLVMFFTFYVGYNYKHFHFYRVISSKVDVDGSAVSIL